MNIPAHKKPIKSIAVHNSSGGPPKVLTGSEDASVKVSSIEVAL